MSDFDPMEPFMEARDEFEARTIVAVLEDAGLEARIFVLGNLGLPHSLTPGSTGIPVHVRRSKIAQARRALDASREVGASVDWESIDMGDEPPPTQARSPFFRTIRRAGLVVLSAALITATVAWALGAPAHVVSSSFGMALLISFLLIATAAVVREWSEQRASAERPSDEGPGGVD
ncbi:MAG: hypothetical protein FJ253_02540 [Phycisphaerae bacterium]|nr:hypothetical protein [Phycisphaerae bacterium]